MSHSIRILGFIIAIVGVVGSFQNCSGQRAFFPNRLAYTPLEKIQDDFVQTYKGQFTAASCMDKAAYVCDHEAFSESLDRADQDADYGCVNIAGQELCPVGLVRTYNSTASTGPKEYEKFYCRYDLADMDGIYPIQATGDDLESALGDAYDLCNDLASR